MLSQDSPLLNLPASLDKKQAVFLDGIRHAVQIADFSYQRLCHELTRLSAANAPGAAGSSYTHVFLDAWGFVDAVDRFRCLWEMQPTSGSIPAPYSPNVVRKQLQDVRDVRNVSAHIAQKIDQIVSLNSSVLGSLRWVTVSSQSPLKIKTHFVRPGIMRGNVNGQFAMPDSKVRFLNGTGGVALAAGKHDANLSKAHEFLSSVVKFIEGNLEFPGANENTDKLPTDMFGSAELDTRDS